MAALLNSTFKSINLAALSSTQIDLSDLSEAQFALLTSLQAIDWVY